MRKLTIGLATHNDYDGLFFTIQSIRMYHSEILNDIEFVIIDNKHDSEHGSAIRNLINHIQEPVQYLPFTKYESCFIKGKVFDLADTPYVLCIDSHVLIQPGGIKKLIDFYESGYDEGNLLQGPLLYDDMKSISTHFNLKWSGYMWGQWALDERGKDINADPFQIPAQGMGLFSCRKDSWLGFNKRFRGFGGEEGYIHKKYEKNGKQTLCLPFLRWNHRFNRPNKASYPNDLKDRFRNYYIGFKELKLPTSELKEHFKDIIQEDYINSIDQELNIS